MKDTFINCAKRLTIAVIGDIMLDVYVDGTVERLSPESPNCIILDETRRTYALGGAGNVAVNLASFGAEVRLCGCLGTADTMDRDRLFSQIGHAKDFVRGELKLHRLMEEHNSSYRRTTVKTRFRSNEQQVLRVDREDRVPVKVDTAVKDTLRDVLDGVDAVIVSDYGKGVISDEVINEITKILYEADKHIPYLVDPKRTVLLDYADTGLYVFPDLVCPNRKEWVSSYEYENPMRIVSRVPHVLVTDGDKGCFEALWDSELQSWTQKYYRPTHKVNVCDPAGAGDTFIAALTIALMNLEDEKIKAKEIGEACRVANCFASCAVEEHGVVVPDVEKALRMVGEKAMVTA